MAQAGNIVAHIRQGVQQSSLADDLKTVLAQVLEQLGKDGLSAGRLKEAAGTVGKIQEELQKADPDKELVGDWVSAIEKWSPLAGKRLRGAAAIASVVTGP